MATNKAEVANEIQSKLRDRKVAENEHLREVEKVKATLEVDELKAAHDREQLKQEYDLKKESVSDASQLQMLKLDTVKSIHANGSFSSVYFNTTDEKEPIYGLIDKFIAMTTVKK